MGYTLPMFEIIESDTFRRWRRGLKDQQARLRINARLQRVANGNLGDTKSVREGIGELRIDYGPGYRVYFTQRGRELVILLAGGAKRTQATDIRTALRLAHNL